MTYKNMIPGTVVFSLVLAYFVGWILSENQKEVIFEVVLPSDAHLQSFSEVRADIPVKKV